MDVHGYEFLRFLGADGSDRCKKIDEFLSVISLSIEEVQAILDLLDVYGIFVGVMLQDELL